MSEIEIKIPNIGDFKDVEVIEVLVSEGQILKKNDPLITIESDKSSVEIPSLHNGIVTELNLNVGDKVSEGDKILEIELKDNQVETQLKTEEIKTIKTDFILGFFGLIMQLGPIANWGLNIDKKTIEVDTEKFETNQKGIYAVGDICSYAGKLKLILSGFHEGALAARACFKLARPNEKYRFEFTTSSKTIKDRLGVKID